jgi:vacuolar-type H+-ATPase subunit F/Vma7
MGRIAVIGEQLRVQGLALAGAFAVPADSPADVRAALAALPDDITVVVLTARAADALGERRWDLADRLTTVMPP